jgi:hypothetical protein
MLAVLQEEQSKKSGSVSAGIPKEELDERLSLSA